MIDKTVWERAEIERSAFEATHTPDAHLKADARQFARYLAPPVTTVYPLEYAFALVGNVRGLRVLDFGCGSGENCVVLARRGARAIGVDISESLIRVARKRLVVNGLDGAVDFVAGSAHDLPIASNSVDLVLGIAVLHHLDLDASAREVHRVLKSNGRAIFQEPVRDSWILKTLRKAIPYQAPDVSPFERPLTTPELRRFASRFRSARIRPFSLPFVNVTQAVRPLRRYIHQSYRLDGAILKRAPALEAFSGIRVIEVQK
jgi:ubiquinone/menaquinone biosynthesis C-methylase UbiE